MVTQAAEHVNERTQAAEEAADLQKPKSRVAFLAAATMIFAFVAVWNIYTLTRPPDILPPAEQVVDLRWFVADAVEFIEDFRDANGRLPAKSDVEDLLEDGFSYELQGDGYVVGLEGEGASVEYDGSMTLDEWLAS